MSGDFQVFISYARKDNIPIGSGPAVEGFITFFHESLIQALTDLGASNVKLWRDTRNISDVDQFEPILEKEIIDSSIMLVVMSPNWLASPRCRREVERFDLRWKGEGEEAVKTRIKVIRKRPNERKEWPPLLQGQQGMAFYPEDTPDGNGLEDAYFWLGKVRHEKYYAKVRDLAGILSREASNRQQPQGGAIAILPTPPQPMAGRTIFVAKTASDMSGAYHRVVHELAERGYGVVPETDIPLDESAVEFIDAALAKADMSVHLVGVKSGYTPQDVAPIVKLQLERAAREATASAAAVEAAKSEQHPPQRGFHRIVWAPKVLEGPPGSSPSLVERDPIAVLGLFTMQLPSDSIDGQMLSKFVDFLLQAVAVNENPPLDLAAISDNSFPKKETVYLVHNSEDSDFVYEVAEALRARNIDPVLPIFDPSKRDEKVWHLRRLRECDAVALIWGGATETWLHSYASELKNWRGLKRGAQFKYRGLVAVPPPGVRKKRSYLHFSSTEIDRYVDLTDNSRPLSELVDQLIPRVRPAEP